ncbi:neugrin [Rhinatrema bivittatum]|uniref:neugrin n=1 Tax=Rhinatrema bivittatum TaxID=194408 RepID=UPI0011292121|nr:neugrin [Rhinatrema bivittatum]
MAGASFFPRLRAALLSPWRKGILSVLRPSSSLLGGGGGGGGGGSRSQDDSELDLDLDTETDTNSLDLRSVMKRQRKAILYQQLKREMEPRGPPERSLTTAAMDQIRHLNKEFPEEWTVCRLAEGFNVSSDVIRRVLRSKFSPSLKQRMKQDAKVAANLESRRFPQHITKDTVQPKIQAGCQPHTRLPSGKPKQQLKQISDGYTTQGSLSPNTLQLQPSTFSMAVTKNSSTLRKQNLERQTSIHQQSRADFVPAAPLPLTNTEETLSPGGEQMAPMEEEWNGELLSEEELERLEECGQENRMKVVQKGMEFFDSDGNFLYRI